MPTTGATRRAIVRRYYAKRSATGWRQRRTPINLTALMSHVVKTDHCWEWVGGKQANGYGHSRWGVAHRAVYVALNGPVPVGLELDHLCRVRHCVNPDHLEVVDRSTNLRRGVAARRAGQLGEQYPAFNAMHAEWKRRKRAAA